MFPLMKHMWWIGAVGLVSCSQYTEGSSTRVADGSGGGEPGGASSGGSGDASSGGSGGSSTGGGGGASGGDSGGGGADPNCDDGESECGESCDGCLISGECVGAGELNTENECEICDPGADIEDWTARDGTSCDDGKYCTISDTCDGRTCGGEPRACDDDVSCNGVGTCDEEEDSCKPGQNQCGDDLCDLTLDQCVTSCDGCLISGQCVAADAQEPGNPCMICDPAQATDSFRPNIGVACGDEPDECSDQDTCDAEGVCQPNHVDDESLCTDGTCQAGVCEPDPFDCILPEPPAVVYPGAYLATGSPPVGQGGKVRDGRYSPLRIDQYGEDVTMNIRSFEFRSEYVQVGQRPFGSNGAAFIPEIQFAGSYATTGNTMSFSLQRCQPSYNIDVADFTYTATANGLITIDVYASGTVIVTTLVRE